ncbi:MAG: KpsF/GutQ family sugar-phosphate isomerase [Pseudarcicella sp.]|nr:KpsF/GutQ family sugar-phosphate isomerase [Pseudarcicella sp.]MBP6410186.1 KpsF/GutQ family sugar-phosphate isomerase [Pseudarcicella sp.]
MKLIKNIQSTAKKVLIDEANAVLQLADLIDDNFEKCVLEILHSNGRLVITGIGKSAIIAQKMVATLNSTGTPALFMHAADAIHGDLGMVQKNDIVLCISKSGDTPEIKVLVPLIKRLGVKLIAMVSNQHSYLGNHSDYLLHALAQTEADILNLAPTTSTTVALALGDALAVCLLEARGFDSNDFATYHPGGALGKKLYLKVSDLYPSHALPVVNENASVKEVIVEISSKRLGATAVVDDKQEIKGIITDGDIRRMLNKYDNLQTIFAKDIMTAQPAWIAPDSYAMQALQMMQEKNISQLIVIEENRPLGFVHLHDLLKEGLV